MLLYFDNGFAVQFNFIFFNIMNNSLLADPGAVVGGATWNQVSITAFYNILSLSYLLFVV